MCAFYFTRGLPNKMRWVQKIKGPAKKRGCTHPAHPPCIRPCLWTYRKRVCGPIRNRFKDLSETGLWTYREPVSTRRQEIGAYQSGLTYQKIKTLLFTEVVQMYTHNSCTEMKYGIWASLLPSKIMIKNPGLNTYFAQL